MPELSRRVSGFTESVIRRMTRLSDAFGAINLSQGFPDFPPPSALTDRLKEVAAQGPHQYSVTYGAADFREALALKQGAAIGRRIDPEREVVVTCGATEAMMCALMAVCNPGDQVIVFSPFYENHGADAILSGAEPVFVPLVPPEYNFDPDVLENAFRQKPKAIIACNPSNPSGKVFTREELLLIGRFAEEYDAFVITDEVYEHIVYAPFEHTYFSSLPGMFERSLTISSLSKTYSVTGWRLGYLIGPPTVVEAARKVHDFLTVGAPSPLQAAAVVGLRMGRSYYEDLRALYTRKRAFFLEGLNRADIPHNLPQGAYFVLADISDFLRQSRFKGFSDLDFCEWMVREVGVAAVPGSSFFKEPVRPLIRLHFAREEATLAEAIARLERMMKA